MIILAPSDVAPLIARGIKEALDGKWAVTRLAELRASGQRATAVVQWLPDQSGNGFVFIVKIRREDGTIEAPPEPTYADCDEPAPVGSSRCCRGRGHPGDHYASPSEGWAQKGGSRS